MKNIIDLADNILSFRYPYTGSSYAPYISGVSSYIDQNFKSLKENDLEELKRLKNFYRQLAYDYQLVEERLRLELNNK